MSFEAMHKVRASGLSDRTQVDVLEALAFFLNQETGACFPSTESIARISRVNDRLVRTTLKALHDLGYVSSIQTPGQRRYFTLHLDKLPTTEPLKESTPLEEPTLPNKNTPLYKTTPLHESTGEECMKVQGTPVEKCSTPLYETTAEQVINKEINKIKNKVCIAPSTEPLENLVKDTPENGTTQKRDDSSTKNGTLEDAKNGTLAIESTENGTTESTDIGTLESTKNGTVTRNKNKEIEQGIDISVEEKPKRVVLKKPDGVSEELWAEWKKFRKNKRFSITERVLNNLTRESEKAGLTLEQAMNIQLDREWRGFNADWLKNKQPQQRYGFQEKKQEERHYELW